MATVQVISPRAQKILDAESLEQDIKHDISKLSYSLIEQGEEYYHHLHSHLTPTNSGKPAILLYMDCQKAQIAQAVVQAMQQKLQFKKFQFLVSGRQVQVAYTN